MYSSAAYTAGYTRRTTGAGSGLPLGGSTAGMRGSINSIPNRASFNGNSTSNGQYGKDPNKKSGTTLAHAARNGVMGAQSSLRTQPPTTSKSQ